jgi:hypothetical protein
MNDTVGIFIVTALGAIFIGLMGWVSVKASRKESLKDKEKQLPSSAIQSNDEMQSMVTGSTLLGGPGE